MLTPPVFRTLFRLKERFYCPIRVSDDKLVSGIRIPIDAPVRANEVVNIRRVLFLQQNTCFLDILLLCRVCRKFLQMPTNVYIG